MGLFVGTVFYAVVLAVLLVLIQLCTRPADRR